MQVHSGTTSPNMRGEGSIILPEIRLSKCSKVVVWGEGGKLRRGRPVVKHFTHLEHGTKLYTEFY
jgi:hypothetical protein